ncbi:MAG TPA: ATP-binding protein, partial [Acidobacteriota bacterium]|nr:ATP-binding protein [Acidobacteriota bacterium]
DGITEAKNSNGEIFGDQRLSDFITHNAWQEPKILISELLNTLEKFAEAKVFQDDLTCVAIRIEENFEPNSEGKWYLELDSNLSELGRAREFVRNAAKHLIKRSLESTFIEQFELAITEALTNIHKHSQATDASVTIEIKPFSTAKALDEPLVETALWVSVSDNGCGIHQPESASGFGLRGMRERVQSFGGRLTIESQPGAGCHLSAVLPIQGGTR